MPWWGWMLIGFAEGLVVPAIFAVWLFFKSFWRNY